MPPNALISLHTDEYPDVRKTSAMNTDYECSFQLLPDCLAPVHPVNGSYDFSRTTFGSVAALTCDPGFSSNMASVTCTESGNWSDTPTCKRIGKNICCIDEQLQQNRGCYHPHYYIIV